jgi:hypothetical protein
MDVGVIDLVRLGPQLKAAAKALGINLTLMTADPI